MGCWNETCMLTNLPIREDEPVVAFLVARRPDPTERTEPDDVYAPVSPPIRGLYDDYGGLKNVQDGHRVLSALLSPSDYPLYTRTATGYARTKATNLEHAIELAASSQLYVKTASVPRNEYQLVYLVMIKDRFFAHALDFVRRKYAPSEVERISRDPVHAARAMTPLREALARHRVTDRDRKEMESLRIFMRRHRKSFVPTTGAGSQTEIEDRADLEFYEGVLDAAREIYRECNR